MGRLNGAISQTIDAQRDLLLQMVLDRHFQRQTHLARSHTEYQREEYLQDIRYHLSYLADSIAMAEPALFVNYMEWARVLRAGLGVPAEDLAVSLEILRDVLLERLPEEMRAIPSQYLSLALSQSRQVPLEIPSLIDEGRPLGDLARRYLSLLLEGDRHAASHLILDSVAGGTSVKSIYLQVFQPVQHEIGRLWQTGKVTVAQEHFCTAATQLIMSQLYPHVFSAERRGLTAVAACVGQELHEVGLRMVADFLEMEGWDTFYLGANVPVEAILQTIAQRKADLLAVSATMTFHLRVVEELIQAVRASDRLSGLKILVGGYPFNLAPDLWKRVGADGHAADAEEAVALAGKLVPGKEEG